MNNYFEFTELMEDGLAMDLFCSMPEEKLKTILDNYMNDLEDHLIFFADTFKSLFKGKDYDEYYHLAKSLVEQLNDIKIILNILAERNSDE